MTKYLKIEQVIAYHDIGHCTLYEHALEGHKGAKGKIMLDQIRSIDKFRLGKRLGSLSIKEMREVDTI